MKSTMENLRSICIRLIVIGLVLFVFTELLMANIAVFYFIPQAKVEDCIKKKVFLRIAVEGEDYKTLIAQGHSRDITHDIISLDSGMEAIRGMSNSLFDVVCTDALAAHYLYKKDLVEPYIFRKNSKNDIAVDRLVLIGHSKTPEFLSQTKGLKIILTGKKGSLDRVVADEFLNYKLNDMSEWFAKVGTSLSSQYALERLASGHADLVLVKETDFKRLYPGEEASPFKMIWYSEPFPRKVVVLRKGLTEESKAYIKGLFAETKLKKYWGMYDESLITLDDWSYRISGKSFMYNDALIKRLGENE